MLSLAPCVLLTHMAGRNPGNLVPLLRLRVCSKNQLLALKSVVSPALCLEFLKRSKNPTLLFFFSLISIAAKRSSHYLM